jgi:hypothetical protein
VPVLANIVWDRVNADCTHLDLVHKTPVDEVPTAIASFQGRILVGVGRMLRLYDMGRKKLLRKCENKVSDLNVISIVVCWFAVDGSEWSTLYKVDLATP